MTDTAPLMIDRYIEYLSKTQLPVLRRSVRELAELRKNEDRVTGKQLARVITQDPLLTLRVLAYLESVRHQSQNHDITTIERAIMMLGVTPFFTHFSNLLTVEDQLTRQPKALIGVLHVITRAQQATYYARDWAIVRRDIDIDEIAVAALLHEAAEILLWCFAPTKMLMIEEMKASLPGLRSAVAQRKVLGMSARDLQEGLVRAWHLPELLINLIGDAEPKNPRIRNVRLACDLARHSAKGWQDPALPDDFTAIGDLLRQRPEAILLRIGVPKEFWPPIAPADAEPD